MEKIVDSTNAPEWENNTNTTENEEQKIIDEDKCIKFYSKLRKQIIKQTKSKNVPDKLIDILIAIPDLFYLLFKLVFDSEISFDHKKNLVLALIYFISPLDLIPDAFAPFGFMDDVYIVVIALNSLLNKVELKYIEKYWLGKINIVMFIRSTIKTLNNYFEFAKLFKKTNDEEMNKQSK